MKYVFNVVFIAAIAVLIYYICDSINRPLQFKEEWAKRKVEVHKQLEDIVELQKMYKSLHEDSTYAGSFDDMLNTFLKDSFSILKIEGDPYDTLKKADTVRVLLAAKDSLFGHMAKVGYLKAEDFNKYKSDNAYIEGKLKEYITKMRFVPFSEDKSKKTPAKEFEIKSGRIALEGSRLASNFATPTFEVTTTVGTYMPEFDPKEYSMYNNEFDPKKVIKVGDLNKAITAGNW
jgi:hypothetical protein